MSPTRFVLRTSALLALALCASGCPSPQLQNAAGDIGFLEERLELGSTWQGGTLEGEATLRNRGRSPLALEWSLPGEGFSFEGLPQTLPAGDVTFTVRFAATAPGTASVKLVATAGSTHRAELELVAETRAIPECPTPIACHTVSFDTVQGRCVETPVADGDSCDPHSLCVTGAHCQAGRCVGTPVVCDDQDACTLNTCNALTGCEFPPAPPCPGDGKCQLGACDPKSGCGFAPAPDGTGCGQVGCDAADVCIGGACVERDPPDGYVCAEPTPCRGPGVCSGSSCVQPPAEALAPGWSYSAPEGTLPLHDFVLEPSGSATLMGFFSQPLLRANTAQAQSLGPTSRRCILWNGQLACADHAANGQVALIDLATGVEKWVFSLGVARPDFKLLADQLFMARVAAMGSDRLAALFESYPRNSPTGSLCRGYFLVVLDAGGAMVSATRLDDPLLSACDHPHPYGVAADVAGNLYLSFSPSGAGSAPLAAQSPTLLISFTRDGLERWRRTEQQVGGELGVAGGWLFPENARNPPHEAATGIARAYPMPPMGRVVASTSAYVVTNGTQFGNLKAYRRGTTGEWWGPTWNHQLPPGGFFLTDELRAAKWTSRPGQAPKTAVLGFSWGNDQTELTAVDFQTGKGLWTCPVQSPAISRPQLFEVADGKLMVMGGAATCGHCDPPYAESNASFWSLDVPGISPSELAWPGTFGGPGHDHLENGVGSGAQQQ